MHHDPSQRLEVLSERHSFTPHNPRISRTAVKSLNSRSLYGSSSHFTARIRDSLGFHRMLVTALGRRFRNNGSSGVDCPPQTRSEAFTNVRDTKEDSRPLPPMAETAIVQYVATQTGYGHEARVPLSCRRAGGRITVNRSGL